MKIHFKQIACAMLAACALVMPVSAGVVSEKPVNAKDLPAGTLIYSEDFNGFESSDVNETLKKLGWSKAEGLTNFTASYTVKGGKLIIKNNVDGSKDSYALMMNDDYLKNVCNQDYTYEYEVTYTGAASNTRYVSLLCNYDGKDNYNTVDMRTRGDGYNQTRRGTAWKHYNDTTCPIRAQDANSFITKEFGETYKTDGMHLIGKTITVRVETSIEKGPTVYVNDMMVSDMQANKDLWQTIDHYAMVFKASHSVDAEIDNIKVWTGLSDEPLPLKTEDPAPATADPITAVVLACAASAGAVFALKKKR